MHSITVSKPHLFFITIVLCLTLQGAARSQESAAKAYEKAYGYVLEEKWSDAMGQFNDFVKKYSGSKLIDAAHYWLCYTRDKSGENREQIFECYREFIGDYPKSKWVSDARSNMVNIASQLSREGKREYEQQLKSMDDAEDDDVKIAALYALANMGSDKALSTVVTLYDQTKSAK